MALGSSPLSGGAAGSVSARAASGLATDGRSIDALKATASRDPKSAIRDTANQFEALFMQELMKSMRQATPTSGMFDNGGTQMGTEMLDTQYATKMTGLPGGLGDMIARQLERQMGAVSADSVTNTGVAMPLKTPFAPAGAAGAPTTGTSSATGPTARSARQTEFLRSHNEAAKAVEGQTGIPAAFMIGQAAHESGWGRREIKNTDGSTSHNLFGIKATGNWTGKVAEVTTTEYVNGQPRKVTAKFRAYDSYEDSFRDYARLLKDNPRYSQVVAQAGTAGSTPQRFAQGLQRAGYATDPAYADKLTRVINTTLSLQRAAT